MTPETWTLADLATLRTKMQQLPFRPNRDAQRRANTARVMRQLIQTGDYEWVGYDCGPFVHRTRRCWRCALYSADGPALLLLSEPARPRIRLRAPGAG